LLTEPQRDSIEVILVSPRNPLNIGAVARAMANFGFSHLTIVAPYEPHWCEAQSAVGAEELLHSAKRTESLAEAVADCTLVVGTGTLAHRKPEQPVVALPELPPHIERALAANGRIALVFGPEKRGLTREDLSHCHLLLEIPTDPRQPSMNLGQAAAVCLYELAVRLSAASRPADIKFQNTSAAASGDLDLLAGVIDQVIGAVDYSPPKMRKANRHDLRLLLRRLAFTESDARRALGFFRRVLHRLDR
jgi:TrmH family RNA methyltransferase